MIDPQRSRVMFFHLDPLTARIEAACPVHRIAIELGMQIVREMNDRHRDVYAYPIYSVIARTRARSLNNIGFRVITYGRFIDRYRVAMARGSIDQIFLIRSPPFPVELVRRKPIKI